MINKKWDQRFLQMAQLVSTWSRDPSTKVGAVIVGADKKIISLGYNGFASGLPDDESLYADRDYKNQIVLHAELNAILSSKHDLSGAIIYSTHQPCMACASVIIQKGLSGSVWSKGFPDGRWGNSINLFTQAGVKCKEIHG